MNLSGRQMMSVKKHGYLLLLALSLVGSAALADEPFKLDASHTEVIPGQVQQQAEYGMPTYAVPTMVPTPPKPKKIKATIEHTEVPKHAPPPPPPPPRPPVQQPMTQMQ